MAKVGSEYYAWGGKEAVATHTIDIYFTKKDGFYAKIPDVLVKNNNNAIMKGESYDSAHKKVASFIDEYYKKGVTQKKIILYYIQWKAPKRYLPEEIFDVKSTYEGSMEHNMPFETFKRDSANKDYHLVIDYKVKWLINVGGKEYIADREVKEPKDLERAITYKWSIHGRMNMEDHYNHWDHLDYSEHMELWFKNTTAGLGKLIGMIAGFFGKNVTQLLDNIAKNGNPMLPFETEKEIN